LKVKKGLEEGEVVFPTRQGLRGFSLYIKRKRVGVSFKKRVKRIFSA